MATWPSTLPKPLINTLQESPPNNVIRTQMDTGVAKVRRRTTASARPISFTMFLTPAQVSTLDDFYVATTFSGALEFNYTHPRTNSACVARFVEPPVYNEQEKVGYRVSVSLEILP